MASKVPSKLSGLINFKFTKLHFWAGLQKNPKPSLEAFLILSYENCTNALGKILLNDPPPHPGLDALERLRDSQTSLQPWGIYSSPGSTTWRQSQNGDPRQCDLSLLSIVLHESYTEIIASTSRYLHLSHYKQRFQHQIIKNVDGCVPQWGPPPRGAPHRHPRNARPDK